MRRQLWCAVLGLVAPGLAAAQQPAANDAAAAARRAFQEVSVNVSKAADMVPADKYNYRPAPTVRTFASSRTTRAPRRMPAPDNSIR